MKKILVINTGYRIFGGEDTNIVDELDLLKQSYKIEYLEFKNSDKLNFQDFISFITSNNKKSNKSLQKIINDFKPDVAYVHNTWFKGNLGIFELLKNEGINTIHKIHNFRYDCTKSIKTSNHLSGNDTCFKCGLDRKSLGFFNKYYQDSYLKSFFIYIFGRRYYKILLNNPMKLLVMNIFHKEYLVNLGIDSSKIGIYYNPINISKENSKGYNSSSNTVVYAGRLTESKGVEELIETWKKADTKGLKLVLIGEGNMENYLRNKYVSDEIHFTGLLTNDESKDYIQRSRAVITSTKLYEGQPRILSEASSYGVPSIFPSFSGMEEYFPEDYEFSFEQFNYAELKEKIELLKDKEKLDHTSKEVFDHLYEMINKDKLLLDFNRLIKET